MSVNVSLPDDPRAVWLAPVAVLRALHGLYFITITRSHLRVPVASAWRSPSRFHLPLPRPHQPPQFTQPARIRW